MNINKIILAAISPSYSDAVAKTLLNQSRSESEINKIQAKKIAMLLEHVKKNVPYYSTVFGSNSVCSIDDLSQIPFLTKEIIKLQNKNLRATNITNKRFKQNSTSGSTGEAMKFYSDNKTDVLSHACTMRGDSWTGWNFGEPKVILWGASKDTNKAHTFKGRLVNSRFLFNNKVLSSFDMTDQDISNYRRIINNFHPTLIVGYPSSLEVFARYILKDNSFVHQPKGIITGGESLSEFQREIIQKAFKAKVLNRYGCREVGHIANECPEKNGLHISMDHVVVEVVDKNGLPCGPGKLGEIVVTDLDNYVFPFIRYKIGDMGILSNRKCICGRELSLLESVEGRVFDVIHGPNGNKVLATYWTINFKYQVKGIEQFQIIQKKIDKLQINLKTNINYSKEEEMKIIKLCKDKLGQSLQIEIKLVDKIKTTEAGKFRWVVSEI